MSIRATSTAKGHDFWGMPLSLRKADLPPEVKAAVFEFSFYLALVEKNRQQLARHFESRDSEFDFTFMERLRRSVRINGAVDVRKILQDKLHSNFVDLDQRLSRSGTYSRGYTYLASRDSGLTAAEKLSIYSVDLFDALKAVGSTSSELETFVIADYIKNAIITMLNALVSEEKVGLFHFEDAAYQKQRSALIELAVLAIEYHYQFFFADRTMALPEDFDRRARDAVAYLQTKSGKRWARLHAASLSRPEASNPLVIFYSSRNFAVSVPEVDTIVCLPSGGTELALLAALQYRRLYGRIPSIVLLPVSFHSGKEIFGDQTTTESEIVSYLGQYKNQLEDKMVMICDDNASTARTLQHCYDCLRSVIGRGRTLCAVAEVDIVRSLVDETCQTRQYVANPTVFTYSVNILPVSKKLRPKTDIKEIMERREILAHHRRHLNASLTVVESIYREVMIDVNKNDTSTLIARSRPEQLISNIQGTPLSNFYAIPITYSGKTFPSVEHAYQYQKFDPRILSAVEGDTMEEIREAMRLRGYGRKIDRLDELFTDERFNAGNVKVIADVLRKHGYGIVGWAEQRVRTMISLLLIKFEDRKMGEYLLSTGNRTIVEGNTWDDTLWGYCDGRGRNLLGRILMNIRSRKEHERQAIA